MAVRGPGVPRAPVQRGARRSRLRRRLRVRTAAARLAGTGSDRGLAVRRLGAVLVAGDHRRGLHPQCPAVLRRLCPGAAGRPGPAARMAARGCRGRLGGGSRQPLALDGAGDTRAARGAPAGLAGCAAPSAAAARGGPPDRRPAVCVDGLAVSAGAAHQLLRLHRHLERVLVLHQPAGLQRNRHQPQRGLGRPLVVSGVVRRRSRAADDPAGIRACAAGSGGAGPAAAAARGWLPRAPVSSLSSATAWC